MLPTDQSSEASRPTKLIGWPLSSLPYRVVVRLKGARGKITTHDALGSLKEGYGFLNKSPIQFKVGRKIVINK